MVSKGYVVIEVIIEPWIIDGLKYVMWKPGDIDGLKIVMAYVVLELGIIVCLKNVLWNVMIEEGIVIDLSLPLSVRLATWKVFCTALSKISTVLYILMSQDEWQVKACTRLNSSTGQPVLYNWSN